MKKLLLSAAIAACSAVVSQGNDGLAYGTIIANNLPDAGTISYFSYWLANSNGSLQYQQFLYEYVPAIGAPSFFTGDSLKSFSAYNDPFFGKVMDAVITGRFGDSPYGGRTTLAHFRSTQPSPLSSWVYFTLDIYLPGYSTPIFSRVGVSNNYNHILVGPNASGPVGTPTTSSHGIISGNVAFQLPQTPPSFGVAQYWVADNYLQSFYYEDVNGAFRGDRVRSFSCTNDGFLGKNAEVWMDGRLSSPANPVSGRSTVARVIVTKSSAPSFFPVNILYIAIYLPNDLTKPIYERLTFTVGGSSSILCK